MVMVMVTHYVQWTLSRLLKNRQIQEAGWGRVKSSENESLEMSILNLCNQHCPTVNARQVSLRQPSHAITSSQPSTWTKRINPVENEPDHSAMCRESQCGLPLYFELANWSCKHISNCILWIVDRLQFAGLPARRRLQRASGTLEWLIHRSTATKTGKVILLSDFETILKLRRLKMCTQEYIALKLWIK